jgi:sugar phosphate isomerase/epimerase
MTNPLGLHAGFTRTLPLPERLSLLSEAGFDTTSLWWEEQRAEVRAIRHLAPEIVRRAGLALDHLHVPYFACNELWGASDLDRAAALALHTSWITDCERHAVPRMVMHVTRGRTPPSPSPAALDAFRRLVAAAEEAGVTLAIENTHSAAHLDFLFAAIPSPALSLCYDVAHDRLHSETPWALLREWGARMTVLHASDTDGRRDWHWLPGDGNTDFSAVAAALPAHAPFHGTCMIEAVTRGRAEDAREFVRRARAAAKRVQDCLSSPQTTRDRAASNP